MIKFYNTKSNQIEEFIPLVPNEVKMYVCGPTVYNHAHIGNARPLIVFDTLRRYLEARGYKVKYASNFTDVDDKIINRAKEEGISEQEVSSTYIEAYQKLRSDLNALDLYATPKVTETMDDIIEFIAELVDKGNAYVVDGDVYFSVESIPNYGSLSKQKIDDLLVGARIDENQKKRNPLDFTLWKKTETGIRWESPFSIGRPGWHTECVVMINNVFKGMIDIHGGGMDLRFPHHENEIAQSVACHDHMIANYWLHNAMINIDGEKMSKSLGNVRWAKDVIEVLGKDLVRYLMLSVHYRKELNFSEEAIETAKVELTKIMNAIKQAQLKLALNKIELDSELSEMYERFLTELDNDLNTPNAYAVMFELVKQINSEIRKKELNLKDLKVMVNCLVAMLKVLGIDVDILKLTDEDIELYNQWNEAKKIKDFEKADKIREILITRGIL